jgi:FtsZ-interacting cell division protein ZipA
MAWEWYTTADSWTRANLIGLPLALIIVIVIILAVILIHGWWKGKQKEDELKKQKMARDQQQSRSNPFSSEEKWPHNSTSLKEEPHISQDDKDFEALFIKSEYVGDSFNNELLVKKGKLEHEMELNKQNAWKAKKALDRFINEYTRLKKEKDEIESRLKPVSN